MTKKVGDQLHAGEDLIGGVSTIFLHNCSLMGNGHLYIDENPLKSLYKWVNCQNCRIKFRPCVQVHLECQHAP